MAQAGLVDPKRALGLSWVQGPSLAPGPWGDSKAGWEEGERLLISRWGLDKYEI